MCRINFKYQLLAIILLFAFQMVAVGAMQSGPLAQPKVKELNFVFTHGAAGDACGTQLLSDVILERLPEYIHEYEVEYPDIEIRIDTMNRCYPNDVDVETWAENIATSVDRFMPGKKNLIIVGHSMGGKSALYGVANNIGGLTDKTMLVVTIDSPVKRLDQYQIAGGGSAADYCRAAWLRSDNGVCESVASYDSSEDGAWVGRNRHWLAFIAAENAPLSSQYNFGGIDAFPRQMDDGVVPLSAQYAEGADVVYYGQYYHSDFHQMREPAGFLAEQILTYIFGGTIECADFVKGGSFERRASGFLGADQWQDLKGDILGLSGAVRHKNDSFFSWKEWEDIIEYKPPTYVGAKRTRFTVNLARTSGVCAHIEEVRWLEPDNPFDFKLYMRTRAAPRQYLRVDWSIFRQDLLSPGKQRDHFQVNIVAGTPLTEINQVFWATDDQRDLGFLVYSKAERPFRWFRADWRVFQKESKYRKLIDEIPAVTN
jgi:pimeloyl-ACP methyl ester carboxylesterase